MADLSSSGKPADARSKKIKIRKLAHEISVLALSIERHEISILDAEDGIERTRETIAATKDSIKVKSEELAAMQSAEEG